MSLGLNLTAMRSKEFKFRPTKSKINLNRALWDLMQTSENVPIQIAKLVQIS